MAAVAAEAAATAASPGEGGAGEAEPEMEPIPGSEAGTDPLPVTATEASVPDGEADGQQSSPQADEPPLPPPPPPPGELARSPEAAGPELEAEEKLPARVAEPAAAVPQGGPELPPSPAPQPEQPPAPEERQEPPLPQPAAPALVPPAGGDSAVSQLIPGSEVRVTLDHIIEDALVVSFRLGEKLFSGVLMDLSKRFGPHGIPVTVFPKREYKDKPEAMQLQSNTFQGGTEVKREVNGAVPDDPSPVSPPEPSLAESLWTCKPPPLFHEGAPYPPPLFIRDTYNQSIPQPPPRKIKRPKRKMYREEPTSIMNAIKLRPRQVLCDKCKNSVVAEKKEIRKGSSASDSSKYEDKKRKNESVTTVNKKLKTDHKVDGKNQNESQRRNAVVKVSNIAHSRGRVVKVSAQANTSKAQLSTKKVLQSKNMDHAKAREVLKIAKEKAQKKQSETSTSKNAHSKVHFTRRYQSPSSGSLPPRVRLKPQRYRNEENDSSLKTGLEKMRSGKMASKPQSRCTSTRSAASSPGVDSISRNTYLCSSIRSNSSSVKVLSRDCSNSVPSSGSTSNPSSLAISATSAVTSSTEVLNLQFVKKAVSAKRSKVKHNKTRSQQMAAITSDSDESCCSLTVSDRPLWIQTGSIEVNSETGSTKTLAGCWFHGPVPQPHRTSEHQD
ncbi:PWWP domain-containing protein 2A isoform X2 [Hyaena hyaena]|uniref:PWWP domain-containing protein 2A isoform X2 n=1 Tax=Hyaena hyaena TaxID=95912 RepID=UPI001920874C|nr:PWWP domain-containing protein 2A isoform X2 [Hyaena hyaena]